MTEALEHSLEALPRRFRPYPEYTDSGVEWLGQIPMHWGAERLKTTSKRITKGTTPTTLGREFTLEGVRFVKVESISDSFSILSEMCGYIDGDTDAFLARSRLAEGDVLVGIAGAIGRAAVVDRDSLPANTNQAVGIVRLHPGKVLPRWIAYCLTSDFAQEQFGLAQVQSAQANLSLKDLGNTWLPIPPVDGQEAIVEFLDGETGEIDALVAKKERLIELLQEKRTALITRAVTKGLDPNAAKKDSGVEWLGEIPAHWETKKIKRLCLVRRGASPRPIDDPIYFDDEGEYAWVRIADVTASERYLRTTTQRLSEFGKSKSVALEPGGLFVSIAATVGKPIITKIKCCIHDGFVFFVGLKESTEYLYYLFSSGEAYKGLGKLGTQLNLNTDTIGDIRVPVPPKEEQKAIVSRLDTEIVKVDGLIGKIRQGIYRLKEFRSALISAAVTGKIDARREVAP